MNLISNKHPIKINECFSIILKGIISSESIEKDAE
jgi:hypothetical protein